MLDLLAFFTIIFVATFLLGLLLSKLKIPIIFGALLIGMFLSLFNLFGDIVTSSEFTFFTNLGMYFLLLVVGFELDIFSLIKKSKIIVKSTFLIIFLESLFGGLFLYFVFGQGLFLSFLIATAFSTVCEAVLVPILDEFKMVNSKVGQLILGIGTFDDFIEVFAVVLTILLIANGLDILLSVLVLFVMAVVFILFVKLRRFNYLLNKLNRKNIFLFGIAIFFIFITMGYYAEAASLGALFSGIILRLFLPGKFLKSMGETFKAITYSFFAPLFFVGVGAYMNISYLISHPLIFILFILISIFGKLFGSYIFTHSILSFKESILLGVGLCSRFSFNIIIMKLLFSYAFISQDMYSFIIASNIVITLIVPFLLSSLLAKWGPSPK